jgi:hypothetical protein
MISRVYSIVKPQHESVVCSDNQSYPAVEDLTTFFETSELSGCQKEKWKIKFDAKLILCPSEAWLTPTVSTIPAPL